VYAAAANDAGEATGACGSPLAEEAMLAPRDALASDCGAVAARWAALRVARAGRADGPLAESDDELADELAAELEAGPDRDEPSLSADAAGMPSAVPTPRKIASAPIRPTNLP
jgi:hypothetical protein